MTTLDPSFSSGSFFSIKDGSFYEPIPSIQLTSVFHPTNDENIIYKTHEANITDADAETLTRFINHGNLKGIQKFVELGGDINLVYQTCYGNRTPLFYALEHITDPYVIKTLIELGAEVDKLDPNDGNTTPLITLLRSNIGLTALSVG